MDPQHLEAHKLVTASRDAKSAVVRSAGRLLDWADDAAGRMPRPSQRETWRGVRVNMISAALISLVGLAASAWADHFYGRVGLTREDAGVSVFRPIAFALVVGVVFVVIPTGFIAVQIRGLRRPGWWFALLIGPWLVFGVVSSKWGSAYGLLALAAVLLVLVVAGHRGVRKRTHRPHLVRAMSALVVCVFITLCLWVAASARPMSYRELAEGGSINLSQVAGLGAPLPNDYAVLTDTHGQRPVVILHRDIWLTVIDPCAPPPYEKVLVRFDAVEIASTTLVEAMELCPL